MKAALGFAMKAGTMRSVADVYQDCLRNAEQQEPLDLLLLDAVGCVLARDVEVAHDYPATDIATCEGFALRSADIQLASSQSPLVLPVHGEIAAGTTHTPGLASGTAMKIGSGATLPLGADAVVPSEAVEEARAEIQVVSPLPPGANVRHKGSDMRCGEVILKKGLRLQSAQISALAAAGHSRVSVHPRPRVVILSIGDELTEVGLGPRLGYMPDVNGQALVAAANEAGAETYRAVRVPDDRHALEQVIDDQLMRADVIVTTGGVSTPHAAVREAVSRLGTVRFDEVAALPRQHVGVGIVRASGDEPAEPPTPIFCLPGDPVAAQISFEIYVRPALRKMQAWKKLNRPAVTAAASKSITSPPRTRQFLAVKLIGEPRTGYRAQILDADPDGHLKTLAQANALAVIPEDTVNVSEGDQLTCMLLD